MSERSLSAASASEQGDRNEALIAVCNGTVFYGLMAVLTFVSLFGSRDFWVATVFSIAVFILLLVWIVKMSLEGEIVFIRTPLDLPMLLGLGLLLFQLTWGHPYWWSGSPGLPGVDKHLSGWGGTINYHATRSALLLFVGYFGVYYLTVHHLDTRERMNGFLVFLALLGGALAFYGLLAFLTSGGSGFLPGSFKNTDHFAAYLGMIIPLCLGFLMALGSSDRRRRRSRGVETVPQEHREPGHSRSDAVQGARRDEVGKLPYQALLVFATGIMGVAVLFTLSRGGIISLLVAILTILTLTSLRGPSKRGRLQIGAAICVVGILAAWIGSGRVLERFGLAVEALADRWTIWRATLRLIPDFLVVGTGFGAYDSAFSRYRPPEIPQGIRIDHAHNDILQLLAEGGLVALTLFLLALYLVVREILWLRLIPHSAGANRLRVRARPPEADAPDANEASTAVTAASVRRDRYNVGLALGGVAALAGIFVHSFFDFSLRVPANGMLLALTAALAFLGANARFLRGGGEMLGRVICIPLGARRRLVFGAAGGILCVLLVVTAARSYAAAWLRSDAAQLLSASPSANDVQQIISTLDTALRYDRANPATYQALGQAWEHLVMRAWNSGLSADGRLLDTPSERLNEAKKLYARVESYYGTAVSLDPANSEHHQKLGWTYGNLARMHKALEVRGASQRYFLMALDHLKGAVVLGPTNADWHRSLALFALSWTKDFGREVGGEGLIRVGASAYQKAAEIDPKYTPEALDAILALTSDIRVIEETIPSHPPDYLLGAQLLNEKGFWIQSRYLFEKAAALALPEKKARYYEQYARALVDRKEYGDASRVLQLALRYDPDDPDLNWLLGKTFEVLEQHDAALERYRRALQLASSRPEPSRNPPRPPVDRMGTQRSREEVVKEVSAAFLQQEKGTGTSSRAKYIAALASWHYDRGQYAVAVTLWQQAVAAGPSDASAHFGLAKSYDAVRAWRSAVQEYRTAIEGSPNAIDYRFWFAKRLSENGLTYQAISLWQEITNIQPSNLEARLNLARAYLGLGDYRSAEQEYERILGYDPQNKLAAEGLARLTGRTSSN